MEEVRRKPMYRYLIILTIASAVGLQAWATLFNNSAVEVAGLEGKHVGVIQSVRELPSFPAPLAIYVMLIIKELRLSALSILLLFPDLHDHWDFRCWNGWLRFFPESGATGSCAAKKKNDPQKKYWLFQFLTFMAIKTCFQKEADPRDIAPSMAVGFTINHIAAVVLPAVGGFLWMLDDRIPFIAGAFMSAVSLTAVQLIRTGTSTPEPGHQAVTP